MTILLVWVCYDHTIIVNNIYEQQKDGIGLGPVLLWLTLLTELENEITKPHMNDGTIIFYCQYVGDTWFVVSPQDVSCTHNLLNSFDKNLWFTFESFKKWGPPFSWFRVVTWWSFNQDTSTSLYVSFTPQVYLGGSKA